MSSSFCIDDYADDVKNWITNYEWPAAYESVYKNESFTNSLGKTYKVLENSPSGRISVLVETEEKFGHSTRLVPKALLFL